MAEHITRVLLIEDNESDFNKIRDLFNADEGRYRLTHCGLIRDGCEKLNHESFDLILLDLSLPDGNGLDALMKLKARSLKIPVIILTSTNDKVIAGVALRQGAQDYIIKEEVTAETLDRSIHYALSRKCVEIELETQRQNFHSIVEKSDEGLLVIDAYGTIKYMNKAAEYYLNVKRELQVGNTWELNLLTGHPEEINISRSDGSKGFGEYRVLPTDWRGKQAYLVIIRDCTEEIRAQQLRNNFMNNVSHELRSPLTSIRESISQIYEGILGKINEDQKKFLALCLRNTDYLKRILDNLLDMSKIESGGVRLHKTRFDVIKLVDDLLDSFSSRIEKRGLDLNWQHADEAVYVIADKDKITQVLVNFIDNAIKFTTEGALSVSMISEETSLICSVTDTGKGIEAENLSGVFEKFEQFGKLMTPEEKGTGLGLAISKGIIELHDGRIWAESSPGEGSRFSFTIPKTDIETEGV